MPILATIRHVAWVACGCTGIASWSCCAVLAVWVYRAGRRKPRPLPRRVPFYMLTEAELDAEIRALLDDARRSPEAGA